MNSSLGTAGTQAAAAYLTGGTSLFAGSGGGGIASQVPTSATSGARGGATDIGQLGTGAFNVDFGGGLVGAGASDAVKIALIAAAAVVALVFVKYRGRS